MVNRNQEGTIPETPYLITHEQMNIIIAFLRYWMNIASWTRAYLRSTVYNLPNLEAIANQLYSAPSDFYETISLFYGTKVAQDFVNHLTNFIISAMNVIDGMYKGDTELVNTSTARWYRSAGELASFLSKINIYWDENIWRNFLDQYIKTTIDGIVAQMQGNYDLENTIYKKLEDTAVLMGSYMAKGIIASGMSPART
ncbi:hypothetical protein [Sinanaerobacter chloroacetimidivorans]|uniref:Uncharacterized protein n=1 Tax=Sinanaerobacter chloroacetimidivorans TaxID=2818044 RepID=A0A8J7W0S2_9FIRM|nr:hypothetical protein [Sinanaerobacter chloroacetimidivorans]MBR0598281.1 hypothetical protein [Sinanaerobacter chloroacetimidivorans]